MMLNGPKNGLTYTQNDREKWRNTFTMFVFASLHVLVTEKVQQASTITLAPRCSPSIGVSRTSYGGISLQSLSFLATCAPNISKLVAFTPLYDVLNATGGGPPWASGEAPSQGVRPFAVAQGQATLHFWAVGGAMLSLTPKNHI